MKPFCVTLAFAAFLSSTFAACGQQKEPPNGAADVKPNVATEIPLKMTEDMKTLVESNNEFAFDLYARLSKEKGNKFFSPYSISAALGMTYAGARGNTAKEMSQTLHFTLDNERLHPAFGDLIRLVQGADKKRNYELATANSLWGNKSDLLLNPKFLRITQTDYQAGFQFVDFSGDPTGARRTINGWVEGKTNNKIVDLIPAEPELIAKDTRLVLVNAIYFKADWFVPFHKEATRPEDFHIPGTPAFKVPMMKNKFTAFYMENPDFQLAQFMYKDKEVSMVVILPKKKDGLPEVEKNLSAKALERALARVRGVELQVALPKFKLTEGLALGKELDRLGMKDAFIPGVANFKGMESGDNPRGSLFINAVVHKAFVEVDEKGTEAAAATGVVTAEKSRPIAFRADHPFVVVLRHNDTGGILFLGRVYDPRGE